MLNSFRMSTFALAAAAACIASPAVSAEHTVLIEDGGYFPTITYAMQGDTIVFVNDSNATQTVSGPNDSWTSGSIPVDGSFALALMEDTPLTFNGGVDLEGLDIEGQISYDPAPLDE
jgi:plastocyanin